MVHMMFSFIQRALSLVIYGVLIILALVWGKRSGGFFAAAGLIVLFAGGLTAGMLVSRVGAWIVGVPNVLGLALLLAAVAWNVVRYHRAEAGVR